MFVKYLTSEAWFYFHMLNREVSVFTLAVKDVSSWPDLPDLSDVSPQNSGVLDFMSCFCPDVQWDLQSNSRHISRKTKTNKMEPDPSFEC